MWHSDWCKKQEINWEFLLEVSKVSLPMYHCEPCTKDSLRCTQGKSPFTTGLPKKYASSFHLRIVDLQSVWGSLLPAGAPNHIHQSQLGSRVMPPMEHEPWHTDLFALGRWKTTVKKTTGQKRNRCYRCENVEENDIRPIILLCQSCII